MEGLELGGMALPVAQAVVTTNRSAQVGDLMVALAKAQGEYDKAVKDSANPYYGSKYADLASVTGAVRAAFSKHGIAIVQTVTADLEQQTAGATTYLYFGEQWVSTTCELPAVGKSKDGKDRFDAQTIGAAQTYARRYTLAPLASVAPEDDDGNSIVRDDARKFGKPAEPRYTPAQAEQMPRQSQAEPHPASGVPANDQTVRAGFLGSAAAINAKWNMGACSALLKKMYGHSVMSKFNKEQIEAALAACRLGDPDEVLAMTTEEIALAVKSAEAAQ